MSLIVFDLDGTLIDSRRDLANSTNEMLETFGKPALPIDEVVNMVGEGARVLVERALAASGLDREQPGALARFREIYDRRLFDTTVPYDGIPEVLAAVGSSAVMAVLSNKPEAPTRRIVDAFDWARYFRWVVGGDSAFPRKPDPAALLHVMDEAGAAPHETLFVGDSRIDLETARRGGVALCLAKYGFGWAQGGLQLTSADVVAETPADVSRSIQLFLNHRR